MICIAHVSVPPAPAGFQPLCCLRVVSLPYRMHGVLAMPHSLTSLLTPKLAHDPVTQSPTADRSPSRCSSTRCARTSAALPGDRPWDQTPRPPRVGAATDPFRRVPVVARYVCPGAEMLRRPGPGRPKSCYCGYYCDCCCYCYCCYLYYGCFMFSGLREASLLEAVAAAGRTSPGRSRARHGLVGGGRQRPSGESGKGEVLLTGVGTLRYVLILRGAGFLGAPPISLIASLATGGRRRQTSREARSFPWRAARSPSGQRLAAPTPGAPLFDAVSDPVPSDM